MWANHSPLMSHQWANDFPGALSLVSDYGYTPPNQPLIFGDYNFGDGLQGRHGDLNQTFQRHLFFPDDGGGNSSGNVSMSANTHASKQGRSSSEDLFKNIVDILHIYFTPAIIAVGLIGNTMSLLVFSLTHLQRLSSSFYLSSLAMADLGFLLGLSIVWLERINIHLYTREGWCQAVQYLLNVCSFLAMWNVVSFTAERYIIVYHPLQKDTFCTKRKARTVVLCLVIFALSLNSYTVWIYDVVKFNKAICTPLPQYYDIMTIITSLDTLFACVIPSLIIVVLNVRIIIKIHHFQSRRTEASKELVMPSAVCENHRRRSLVHTSISTTGSMHIKFSSSRLPERNSTGQRQETLVPSTGSNKKVMRGQSQFRTARMLLILSSVFVLLILPNYAFKFQAFVQQISGSNVKAPAGKFEWHKFFQIVYFLNFAINFFIYSACGRQFRTGLRRLCRKWRYKIVKCGKVINSGRNQTGEPPDRGVHVSAEGYNLKVRALQS